VPVEHYENFPVASWLVPARVRPAIVAIYAFARGADDLADEGDAPTAVRLAALDRYAAMLDAIERGETPGKKPFDALARAIRAHALPIEPFRDLLSAFRQDVTTPRYATFADVLDYCRRSANPVGRLLLALYGVSGTAERSASDAVCTGLQLTNFWQDVALDWKKGRVYLPGEDLSRFEVTEAQIAEGRCNDCWRALMAFQTARARGLLESGRPLTRRMPWRAGLELSAVIAGGLRILSRIDAIGGDVFHQRPTLARRDWLVVALRAVFPARPTAPEAA